MDRGSQFKVWTKEISQPWLDYLAIGYVSDSGERIFKTKEGRRFRKDWAEMEPGQQILAVNDYESQTQLALFKIVALHREETFEKLVAEHGRDLAPQISDEKEIVRTYLEDINGTTDDEVKKTGGAVAVELKLISKVGFD